MAAVVAFLPLAGCDRHARSAAPSSADDSASEHSDRPRSEAFIAAGNEAYRAAEFELALKRYAEDSPRPR